MTGDRTNIIRTLERVNRVGTVEGRPDYRLTFTDGTDLGVRPGSRLTAELEDERVNEGQEYGLELAGGQVVDLLPVTDRVVPAPVDSRTIAGDTLTDLLHGLELEGCENPEQELRDALPLIVDTALWHWRAERDGGDDLTGPQRITAQRNPVTGRPWTGEGDVN